MNERLTCPDLEELAAWIDGLADERTRLRLAAHVADCDRCAETVESVLAYDEELELIENAAVDGSAREVDEIPEIRVTPHPESDFDPDRGGFPPVPPRVRWKPYLAAALMVCALVLGIRLIQDRSSGLGTLRQELRDLEMDSEITRKVTNPLTEKEVPIARKCRLFLKSTDAALDSDVLIGCLRLVARDPDLASQVVVEAPGLIGWIGSPDPLGASSCQVLGAAWESLRRARQDELRPHQETCRSRLSTR